MIKFLPLGGADEIGASCYYLNLDGTGILLDCGIHPRKKGGDALPAFHLLENLPLDFVFISHAHQDHLGALPFLIKKFPHVIIYSTKQTKEIAYLTLHNSINIIKSEFNPETHSEVYSHDEIDLLVRSIREVDYNEDILLKGMTHTAKEKIAIKFIDAGHILGSACILLSYKNKNILYTGDINLTPQTIMSGAQLKRIKADVLITESTYASTSSTKIGNWKTEVDKLVSSINKILHKGGSVLIPVFSLGKTQELLSSLYLKQQSGKLTETNLFTGGLGVKISSVYDSNKYVVKRNHTDLDLKSIPQININEINDFNLFVRKPGVVLASSGMMLQGTTSYKLLEFWLRQKTFGIFIVGYMDEETPGYKIENARRGEKLSLYEEMEPVKVNCEIKRYYLPSHSKREDLLKIVQITSPKSVVLVHGDVESKDWLGYNILNHHKKVKVYSAETGKEIDLSVQ